VKFGPVPLSDAGGAIAAHSLRHAKGVIKKGTRLTGAHIAELAAAGVPEIIVARLEPGDLHEDEAARRVADVLKGPNVRIEQAFTGRCNLFAESAGLLLVDRSAVNALNRADPGITVATLSEYRPVEAGRMVATVKIIPFAVPEIAVREVVREIGSAALSVAPWRELKVGLAATELPSLKPSVMDKTRRILEERLRSARATLIDEIRVPHREAPLAAALTELDGQGADLLVAFGASAIVDEEDVIPAAIRAVGGCVLHFGMPVDPGNLLLLGMLNGKPVLGAPGCARSPAENGFDWVLNRLLAGLPVSSEDVTGMGVGGLLMEIVSRPQPREPAAIDGSGVAAIVLAAGQARRMGGTHKLLARLDGESLVRRAARTACGSQARPVIVVTGHRAPEIEAELLGLNVRVVHNPDYAEGLATSLKAGLACVPSEAGAAIVLLADMPGVTSAIIDRLIGAFAARKGPSIVLPTAGGKRGNPVLWSREFFPELMTVMGDSGARHILGAHEEAVERVEIGAAAAVDVDTPEALRAIGGTLPPLS
jgi:molybdenum cofactor cytidylyltransferase